MQPLSSTSILRACGLPELGELSGLVRIRVLLILLSTVSHPRLLPFISPTLTLLPTFQLRFTGPLGESGFLYFMPQNSSFW